MASSTSFLTSFSVSCRGEKRYSVLFHNFIQISELILNVKVYFKEDNTSQDQSPTSTYDEEN